MDDNDNISNVQIIRLLSNDNCITTQHETDGATRTLSPSLEHIRQVVECNTVQFYFIPIDDSSASYIRNIVKLNPKLVVDDILARKLESLHSGSSIDTLHWLYHLLLNRSFTRGVLRMIFEAVVYLDMENESEKNFYKYRILGQIIQDYSVIDTHVCEKNTQKLLCDERLQCLTADINLAEDNCNVLANLIWENTLYLIESEEGFSDHGDGFVDSIYYEAYLILDLYTTIIKCTGKFYQNRIQKNSKILSKLRTLGNFEAFLEVAKSNFDPSFQATQLITGFGG